MNDSLSNAEYQAQCILHSLVQYSCAVEHVEELSLEDADLLNIETDLLAACVAKLERLNLRYCKVRREDILAIVSTIPSSPNMKSINLSCMDLSCLSPHLLKEAAASLEELSLNYSNLSTEQCEGVVSGVRDSFLATSLGLGGQENLKHLPRELLLEMITPNMKCLDLGGTNLTTEQMETIFEQISKLPSMSKLDLTRNILTGVDKSILATALANVEDLGLMQTELSKDQVDALLEQIVIKKSTKEVNLC